MKRLIQKWYTRQLNEILSKPKLLAADLKKIDHCLNKGADPDVQNGKLLQQAVYTNNQILLSLALKKGAKQSAGKYEALNWAIFIGQSNATKKLLNHDVKAIEHIRAETFQQAVIMATYAKDHSLREVFSQIVSEIKKNSNYQLNKDLEEIENKEIKINDQQLSAIENFILQQRGVQKPVKSCCQKNSI